MLLRTRARVLAFEPHPRNLWHLTRSLRLGPTGAPDTGGANTGQRWAERVAVYPIALGARSEHRRIFSQRGNAGDTRLLVWVRGRDRGRIRVRVRIRVSVRVRVRVRVRFRVRDRAP